MPTVDKPDFDWDDANISHLAKHRVRPPEAEQVIRGSSLTLGEDDDSGELRQTELGETASGRLLLVAWTWRGRKIRVVTAFPPNREWRRYWRRMKKGLPNG